VDPAGQGSSHLRDNGSALAARIWLRPLGSPAPLGFAALAGVSLVAAGFDFGWVAQADKGQVGTLLIAFAFPLQLVASILAFLARDGATGTAFGIQAASWLAIGLIYVSSPPGSTSPALGLLLVAAGGALALGAASVALTKIVPALVVGLTGIRFATAGIYELSSAGTWKHVAGAAGLAVVAVAAYGVLALVLEDGEGTTVLPLGRVRRGALALRGSPADQVEPALHEPGVRGVL
jgi:succinate-acetate transporter protein